MNHSNVRIWVVSSQLIIMMLMLAGCYTRGERVFEGVFVPLLPAEATDSDHASAQDPDVLPDKSARTAVVRSRANMFASLPDGTSVLAFDTSFGQRASLIVICHASLAELVARDEPITAHEAWLLQDLPYDAYVYPGVDDARRRAGPAAARAYWQQFIQTSPAEREAHPHALRVHGWVQAEQLATDDSLDHIVHVHFENHSDDDILVQIEGTFRYDRTLHFKPQYALLVLMAPLLLLGDEFP